MKKIIAIAASMLCIVAVASAQPRALGIRGGWGAQLSYEHSMGSENFLEAELGLYGNDCLHVEALYNYIFAGGGTSIGDWNAYWGWGAAAGLYTGENGGMNVAAAAQIGVEFNFSIPIQLSLDLRPQIGAYINGGEAHSGLYSRCYPALGFRYKF